MTEGPAADGERGHAPPSADPSRTMRQDTMSKAITALFDQEAVGITLVDFTNRMAWSNRRAGAVIRDGGGRYVTVDELQREWRAGDEGLTRTFRVLVDPDADDSGVPAQFEGEKRWERPDGSLQVAHVNCVLTRDDAGRPATLLAVQTDVSERHALAERLRQQAEQDPLTGLGNRARLTAQLRQLTDRSASAPGRAGLCFVDLDGFKNVNDGLGHPVGDRLLVEAAARMAAVTSGGDRLLTRMGGDEFIVLVPGTEGPDELIEVAEKILDCLREPVQVDGHRLHITASIGLVEADLRGGSAEGLLRDADIALYWAKRAGRNRWERFDPERGADHLARFSLAAEMPAALANGDFYLEYQPIVRLADGALHGAEALVRWEHPRRGRLSPATFIELAEETGMIVQLGRWVLHRACEQAWRWWERHGDAAPVVSVNVAGRQLRDTDLVADVRAALWDWELAPGLLQLELTESTLVDAPNAIEVFTELREIGVHVAIDDFGTGYSNLGYLRDLPADVLKVAGRFVAGLADDSQNRQFDTRIVSAITAISHQSGQFVVIEGVETADQLEPLRSMECDAVQGWVFGRAGPPEDIDGWLAADHACTAGGE